MKDESSVYVILKDPQSVCYRLYSLYASFSAAAVSFQVHTNTEIQRSAPLWCVCVSFIAWHIISQQNKDFQTNMVTPIDKDDSDKCASIGIHAINHDVH